MGLLEKIVNRKLYFEKVIKTILPNGTNILYDY